MNSMRQCGLVLVLAVCAGPVGGQEAGQAQEPRAPVSDTDCAAAAWPLDAPRARLAAPGLVQVASGGTLAAPGSAELQLRPRDEVRFALRPGRPPSQADAFAGFLTVRIPHTGLWQFTLSGPAWLDAVEDGRLLPVVAFTGVHHCPGVRKSLRFSVKSGAVVLQISGATNARMRLDVSVGD